MKKLFEELVAKAKKLEKQCKKNPIDMIENPDVSEILLEGNYYHVLSY